ncbi:GtrA family protein [Bacillus sinesaloumensis]|uniref:GtrA family protein n=1 Tax=Litchfieldia sinesaloumensis TaxID=1926280 RepID=UPI001F3ABBA1|nr:GtrA family protein [Bacillus sinesaloumensis]
MVGFLNTFVGLTSIFFFLEIVGLSYWQSTFIGNLIGATVSYVMNRRFTFSSRASFKRSIPLFLTVIICCYFLSFYLSKTVADFLSEQFTNQIAIILGTGFYTITNYIGQKYIVFSE